MSLGTSRVVEHLDRLDALGYRLYRRLFDPDGAFVSRAERTLTQAAIAEPVEMYVSRALALALLAGGGSWLLATVLTLALGPSSGGPVAVLGTAPRALALGALVAAVSVGLTLAAFAVRPSLRASRREREIDFLLPDAVSYMYALSTGGLNEVELVRAMAAADDTYGEVAREFQRIVRETEYFDMDHRTAIREQALVTRSDGLSEFLTDLLSIVSSGGDVEDFLSDRKEKHMRAAKHQQEATLETLELFGELYIALSLFPLLLIIVLVIMSMMGTGRLGLLYATVYGLIPVGNLAFLVLVSMVKRDDPGDGFLTADGPGASGDATGTLTAGRDGPRPDPLGPSLANTRLSGRIARRERVHEVRRRIASPHAFFRERPLAVLWVTLPATLLVLGYAAATGAVPTTWGGLVEQPILGTFAYLYLPVYLTLLPLSIFHEWDQRARRPITRTLSDTLRKLSSANDTGLTLLESIETVAETSTGKLADDLAAVCAKVRYGTSLEAALVEFNNAYHVPRLARTVKLVAKAQETSSQITSVLTTAAQASENQDELERIRRSRTRLQVVIIVMTFLTMLAVTVVLKTQFLNVMTEVMSSTGRPLGVGDSIATGVDQSALSLLLFHAVTLQAVLSGIIGGYIREANLLGGLKFVVALSTVALSVWVVVG